MQYALAIKFIVQCSPASLAKKMGQKAQDVRV
jgi:hypothetical protein